MVSGSLTSADAGKTFAVDYAGASGKSLVGTIVSVSGSSVTLDTAATSNQTAKPCRWGTNNADNLQRWLKAQHGTITGLYPYSQFEARLRGGGSYLVHRTGNRACMDMTGGSKLIADNHASLVAAGDDDIIINCAASSNEIRGFQFKYGKHAIQFFGRAAAYGDSYISHPQNVDSSCKIDGCYFWYQHGPSIWQDMSNTGPPSSRRSAIGHLEISNFSFYGQTMFWGGFDMMSVHDGYIVIDHVRYPVLWDDAQPMGWVVHIGGCNNMFYSLDGAPANSSAAPWFEGAGHITTRNVRVGGEGAKPVWRLRSEGMTYAGISAAGISEFPELTATIDSDSDALASTDGKHLIEVYDSFPAFVSLQRILPFGTTDRNWAPFANSDCTIWIDSDSVPLSSIFAQNPVGLRLDIDLPVGLRFVHSTDPTSSSGEDITHYFTEYRQTSNAPETPRAAVNYWYGTPANLSFDVSYGSGTVANGFGSPTDILMGGYAVRQFTSNTNASTANIGYGLDYDGSTKWGTGVPAGIYTFSVYVLANFSGVLLFERNVALGQGIARRFTTSSMPQRLSWTFYHDGTATRSMFLHCNAIPGTDGTEGSIAVGLPMINSGEHAASYVIPGLTLTAGTGGEAVEFGNSENYGRDLSGYAKHAATSGSAQNIATITLPRNGTCIVEARFLARYATGAVNFTGVRRACFKRESGTTTQIGATETIGTDRADAGAAAWVATIDNSGDTLRFRETSDSGAIWEVDWDMSIKVT
jgi:hypothetical protein